MVNFYEIIRDDLRFNKFQLKDLLFVEYTCPITEEEFGVWTQNDYIIHVLSGKKTWRTLHNTITATKGDTVYVKKGGSFIKQFFNEDFCMLGFFLTDDFIRGTVNEIKGKIPLSKNRDSVKSQAVRISNTSVLSSYFHAILHYFEGQERPFPSLLELKFKELLFSILSNEQNYQIADYFLELSESNVPSLTNIMEANYCFNIPLEKLASMCHRSLSTFKRDFKKYYNTTPGKWIMNKRLEHAAMLLHNESSNITQIAFICGFEDSSHFSRAFKEKFGVSPQSYRNRIS